MVIVGSGFTKTVNVAEELDPQVLLAVTETVPITAELQVVLMAVVPCPPVIEPPAPPRVQV